MVRQAARSSYTCNEAAVGAAISRHDLSIEQVLVHQSTRLGSMSQKGVHPLSVYICRLQNVVPAMLWSSHGAELLWWCGYLRCFVSSYSVLNQSTYSVSVQVWVCGVVM